MKKVFLILALLVLASVIVFISSCETDPKESCQQDEICTGKSVTACCTDNTCIYKYNGNEYAEEEIDQLAIDLGCSVSTLKSYENDIAAIKKQLQKLMDKAHKARK